MGKAQAPLRVFRRGRLDMAESKRDYYEVLGVSRDADDAALKKAYRALAKKYHPDANPGDQAAADKFKEASEAYSVLSDPEKRRQYDQFGQRGLGGWAGGAGSSAALTSAARIWAIFSATSSVICSAEEEAAEAQAMGRCGAPTCVPACVSHLKRRFSAARRNRSEPEGSL